MREQSNQLKNNNHLQISTALVPLYYQEFHCLAGACRNTCCKGWKITFDKKDYLRLRNLQAEPELRKQLDNLVCRVKDGSQRENDKFYAEFWLPEGGNCPLQNEQGLCSLQMGCGPEALPFVCRIYPREECYTPTWKICYVSTTCEGVLQQFWEMKDGIDFTEVPLHPSSIWSKTQYNSLWCRSQEILSAMVDILQNRSLSISHRILYLGIALQKLCKMDWVNPNVDSWLASVYGPMEDPALGKSLSQISGDTDKFLAQNLYTSYEALGSTSAWNELMDFLQVKFSEDVGEENIRENVPSLAKTGKPNSMQEMSNERNIDVQQPTQTESPMLNTQYDVQQLRRQFQSAQKHFEETFGNIDHFWENTLINLLFDMKVVCLFTPDQIWAAYVSLCNYYSVLWFTSVFWCDLHPTKEELFHIQVVLAREILHNTKRQALMAEAFQHNESDSLAHMAILVLH